MSEQNKKILITGGSGFIGTNLIEYFLQHGYTVLNIDIKEPKNIKHFVYWKKTDLFNWEDIKKNITGFSPTHVVHLAARTDLKGIGLKDYSINTIGTSNLIRALTEQHTVERVLFTSTMLVCRPGYIPKDDFDFSCTTFYGESKKNMECEIRKIHLSYEWCIIRPTSIWGPWFGTPYKDFFDRVLAKKMYNIKNACCTKTYGFVLNSVFQIEKLLFSDRVHNKVFYIGDDPPIHIGEWANQIASAIGFSKVPAFPLAIFKLAAFSGDIFDKLGIDFPITSFRLKNMTTDNILPLKKLYEITGPCPFERKEAIEITLQWMRQYK